MRCFKDKQYKWASVLARGGGGSDYQRFHQDRDALLVCVEFDWVEGEALAGAQEADEAEVREQGHKKS